MRFVFVAFVAVLSTLQFACDKEDEGAEESSGTVTDPKVVSQAQPDGATSSSPAITPLPEDPDAVPDGIDESQPPAAFTIEGTSGVLGNAVPELKWTEAVNAAGYDVVVGTGETCADPVSEAKDLKVRRFVPTLAQDGAYSVCVTALNAAGQIAASNSGSFTFAVDRAGPAALASFAAGSPTGLGHNLITWQANASRADYAKLEFRSGTAGTAPDCATGTLLTRYAGFFSNAPIAYAFDSAPGSSISVRACLYDALDNLTSTDAMTIATLTASSHGYAFVTSETFTANLKGTYDGQTFASGSEGADYRCQYLADVAGLDGRFKALLGGERDVKTWSAVSGVYLVGDALVAASESSLFDASTDLAHAIDRDENGDPILSYAVWTGYSGSGVKTDAHCRNWSTDSAAATGSAGLASAVDDDWAYWTSRPCDSDARLYCIEQPAPPERLASFMAALDTVPTKIDVGVAFAENLGGLGSVKLFRAKGKTAFNPDCTEDVVGAELLKTYDGATVPFEDEIYVDAALPHDGWYSYVACTYDRQNLLVHQDVTAGVKVGAVHSVFAGGSFNGVLGGLMGADASCQTLASGGGLAGTWKAILSSASATAAQRLVISMPIYDSAGNFVADGANDLWDGELGPRGILGGADGVELTGYHWVFTGSTSSGATYSSSNLERTCSSWTDSAANILGGVGAVGRSTSGWVNAGANNCGSTAMLYCIDGQ